jgi:tRNA-specific 2-thiouridylase
MKSVVAIAMSGGIDSLVSAYVLKKEGVSVFGLHFTTGFEPPDAPSPPSLISHLSAQIDLPVHGVDLSELFRTTVVDYFISAYRAGVTPNPCLVCNPQIKFDALFAAAEKLGADILATGHYARVKHDPDGRCRLFKGVDQLKDQSYFLSFLSRHHLKRACFPLGGLTKHQVKALAEAEGLMPVSRNESQDVCFIHDSTYADFLTDYGGLKPKPGPVVTAEGETVGSHNGLYRFTVGQRRGINCPSSEPYYVLRLDPRTNTLIVGRKHDLLFESCLVKQVHWLGPAPKLPMTVDVRLRYRHQAVRATVHDGKDRKLTVRFASPQMGPTPGQGAVFYLEDEVIGAGIISS